MNDEYILCHHGVKGQKWGVIRDRRNAAAYSRKANKAETLYKKSYKYNESGKYVKASRIKDKADKQYEKAKQKIDSINDRGVKKDLRSNSVTKSMNDYRRKGVNNKIKKSGITARKNIVVRDFLERHRNTTLGVIGTGLLVAGGAFASSFAAVPVAAISAGMIAGEAITLVGFATDGLREIYREQRDLDYNKRR